MARGRVPDDWVEKGRWRRWGAPADGLVTLNPGGGRQLRALLADRRADASLPLPVVLLRGDDDGPVRVAVAGQVVGAVPPERSALLPGRVGSPGRARVAVCGMVSPAPRGEEWPSVRPVAATGACGQGFEGRAHPPLRSDRCAWSPSTSPGSPTPRGGA